MKKIIGSIVVILIALFAISGCGSNSTSSSNDSSVYKDNKYLANISEDSYWLSEMQYLYNYINEYDVDVPKFKEREKIANTLTVSNYNNKWESLVYATEDPSFATGICYVALEDEEIGEYVYWGELNKDGYPDGTGIVYECDGSMDYDNPIYLIKYMGEFKDGYYEGYGVEFKIPDLSNEYTVSVTNEMFDENIYLFNEPIYEGYFDKGVYRGAGMEIISNFGGVNVNTGEVLLDPNKVEYCLFIGEYKKGLIHGDGMIFDNGVVEYEGEFKRGNTVE